VVWFFAVTPTPLPPSSHAKPVDSFARAAELEAELKRHVSGEVRFDRGSRALYASDGSNYRQIPIGLVVPRNADDVIATVAACREFGAPVLPRGGGTSLAGQCCNVAVVLDFTKYMNQVVEIDPEKKFARVQPGIVLDILQGQLRPHQLIFAPDPSTHSRCTIGGMIGNNSCGTHSLLGGKTVENVEELNVVLYDSTQLTLSKNSEAEIDSAIRAGGRRGEIYAKVRALRDQYAARIRTGYPRIPRRVSGYNLDELLPENGFHLAHALVGTEGTCAVVLEAKLRLIHSPQHRTLVALGFPDVFIAADHVPQILPFKPIGLEGLEGSIVDGLKRRSDPHVHLLPDGHGFLFVEFGTDDPNESNNLAQQLVAAMQRLPVPPSSRIYSGAEAKLVWQIREAGPRAAAFAPGAPPEWEGWDDAAVAPEKLGSYLRGIRKLLDEYNYKASFYGHFGHGCIHMRVSFDLLSEAGIRNYAAFIDRAADLVVSHGGSLSGEHGDGQSRAALLPKMFGPELVNAFREFKRIWDPDNKMNPGKVVDPYPPTENLRLGADYKPQQPQTFFKYPDDDGSFTKALTLRCVGLGACRKKDTGTMCPSYMATLEEEHSTRGRAHMLFEMLQGEVIRGGWKDEQIKRSLDLCLSCKACKAECPSNVDMATYKAEFLAHYYQSRRRPLNAYAFGMIDRWARAASFAPGVANFVANAPLAGSLVRSLLKFPSQRKLPQFAAQPFQSWAAKRTISTVERSKNGRPSVLLWPDTFNNFFHPEIAQAAFVILSDAGFNVSVPRGHLCCGRPLYDFGMLNRAKEYLQRVMDALTPEIDAGIHMVVLEPSCASVFRDELRSLFPDDPRAQRLRAQTFLLSEFLECHAPGYQPARINKKILLHGHCHEKALMGMGHAEALLRKAGANVQVLDSGCCGMAGPFGFERDKFSVSQAIGERVLLPAVREASDDTLIVTDGFSCREQIFQATAKRAFHLAEVLCPAASSDRC
jgi:FAD/FMN-containing dehydrogenase/Fe-S oxidoreductase